MYVSEIMNKHVISVTPNETALSTARLLFRHNIGSVPVCTEDGNLRGVVTDRDITLRCVAADNDPEITPVKDIMSKNVISVSPDADISYATRLMCTAQVRRLPVADGDKLVGMLSLADLARHKSCCIEAAKALTEISSGVKKYKTE